MQTTFQKSYEFVIHYGMSVIAAIVILVIGRLVAKFITNLIEEYMLKMGTDKTVATFVRHVVFYSVMTFVCIAALNKLGVETSSFIAVVGAGSLAVGLALQGSLANFASGFMLILFHPFKVGDIVDAGGAQGRVEEIQIFSTIIITSDKKRVVVPNSKITGDKITIDQSNP